MKKFIYLFHVEDVKGRRKKHIERYSTRRENIKMQMIYQNYLSNTTTRMHHLANKSKINVT